MKTFKNLLFLLFFFVFVFSNCDKNEVKPSQEYYSIEKPKLEDPGFPLHHEQDSILYKSIILKVGTLSIKSYGVCYGLRENPNLSDLVSYSKTPIDTIPFIFENKLKKLKIGTIYQIRTFMITTKDTLFGPNNYFRTIGKNEWFIREKTPYIDFSDSKPDKITNFFDEKRLFFIYQNENKVWEYDTRKYNWKERKSIPSLIKGKTSKYSFMINGKAYCGNLLQTVGKLENEFWEFDDKANDWKNMKSNIPDLKSDQNFGFTDGNFGYVINITPNNIWSLWKFDPKNNTWKNINETPKNETIKNLFSDGKKTFLLTSNNTIYKVENGVFEFFMSVDNLFDNNGKLGYYGGILQNKLILGEYTEYYVDGEFVIKTKYSKSIDMSSRQIESLIETDYEKGFDTIQNNDRLFLGAKAAKKIGVGSGEKFRIYEYFPN